VVRQVSRCVELLGWKEHEHDWQQIEALTPPEAETMNDERDTTEPQLLARPSTRAGRT
jgi:hypothetical protein